MIILDTNIVSEMGRESPDGCVVAWFHRQQRLELYSCSVVVMEQIYGAEKIRLRTGSRRYFRVIEGLMSELFRDRVAGYDIASATLSGEIRARREAQGRSISVQDAMIAAICLVNDATLATRNTKDFQGLDLRLVNPFEGG